MKDGVLKSGLKALYYSGSDKLLAPFTQGVGLIFMLHQVTPDPLPDFAPNGILKVEPEFLDAVLGQVRAAGFDIVTLDEACMRIAQGEKANRFACFTLDDGYRDNLEHAWPVFRKHQAPFTIYVPSDYADGKGELWWLALERVIAENEHVSITLDDVPQRFPTRTTEQKQAAYNKIYWWLRRVSEDEQRSAIRDLCAAHEIDQASLCRELIMSWDDVRRLNADPLVTIGAHTAAHYAIAKLPPARARQEMTEGAERIAAELGERPEHLSYPYGDPSSAGPRDFAMAAELGFKTAVTTRKGVLFADHGSHMTALPRVSLNGAYQSLIYTQLYMSGAPFALWNRFRKVDAA